MNIFADFIYQYIKIYLILLNKVRFLLQIFIRLFKKLFFLAINNNAVIDVSGYINFNFDIYYHSFFQTIYSNLVKKCESMCFYAVPKLMLFRLNPIKLQIYRSKMVEYWLFNKIQLNIITFIFAKILSELLFVFQ